MIRVLLVGVALWSWTGLAAAQSGKDRFPGEEWEETLEGHWQSLDPRLAEPADPLRLRLTHQAKLRDATVLWSEFDTERRGPRWRVTARVKFKKNGRAESANTSARAGELLGIASRFKSRLEKQILIAKGIIRKSERPHRSPHRGTASGISTLVRWLQSAERVRDHVAGVMGQLEQLHSGPVASTGGLIDELEGELRSLSRSSQDSFSALSPSHQAALEGRSTGAGEEEPKLAALGSVNPSAVVAELERMLRAVTRAREVGNGGGVLGSDEATGYVETLRGSLWRAKAAYGQLESPAAEPSGVHGPASRLADAHGGAAEAYRGLSPRVKAAIGSSGAPKSSTRDASAGRGDESHGQPVQTARSNSLKAESWVRVSTDRAVRTSASARSSVVDTAKEGATLWLTDVEDPYCQVSTVWSEREHVQTDKSGWMPCGGLAEMVSPKKPAMVGWWRSEASGDGWSLLQVVTVRRVFDWAGERWGGAHQAVTRHRDGSLTWRVNDLGLGGNKKSVRVAWSIGSRRDWKGADGREGTVADQQYIYEQFELQESGGLRVKWTAFGVGSGDNRYERTTREEALQELNSWWRKVPQQQARSAAGTQTGDRMTEQTARRLEVLTAVPSQQWRACSVRLPGRCSDVINLTRDVALVAQGAGTCPSHKDESSVELSLRRPLCDGRTIHSWMAGVSCRGGALHDSEDDGAASVEYFHLLSWTPTWATELEDALVQGLRECRQ